MASDQSPPDESRGQVDNQPATFKYDAQTDSLTFTFDDGSHGLLKKEEIIGVCGHEDLGRYTLLYVKEPVEGAPGSVSGEGASIQALDASNFPQNFVQAFKVLPQVETPSDDTQQSEPIPNTHVIVSTLSGTGKAPLRFQNFIQPFLTALNLRQHTHYVVHYTESPRTITDLTKSPFLPQANQGVAQRIILLSGDGGVVDILNALHSAPHSSRYKEPVIGLLPMGTGNALAHSSGITKDRTLGLATLARGRPRHLPILKARFSPGSRLLVDEGRKDEVLTLHENGVPVLYSGVVCSWGLHAGLVADSDTTEYRKYGVERFKMAAKEALYPADGSEPHRYKATVSLLTRDAEGNEKWTIIDRPDHAYVLATTVSNLERDLVISPASKPLDGHLKVIHFGHVNGDEFMRIMNLAYQGGKHVQDEFVSYEDVEGLRIEFQGLEKEARWRRICVDGTIVRVEEDGWVEVRKDEAKVLKLLTLD